jgi:hypothetical protein
MVLNLTWHTVTMAKNPQGHFEEKTSTSNSVVEE